MRPMLLTVALLAAAIPAQTRTFSLIVSPDVAFKLENNVAPKALGLVDDQESIIVTPSSTSASVSHPFRTFTTLNVMQGDDSPQAGTPVQGVFDIEIGRLQPRTPLFLFVSIWTNNKPGGWVDATPLAIRQIGNRFLELDPFTMVPLVNLAANANGYAALQIRVPANVPMGAGALVQGVGTPFGAVRLALTATTNLTF